MAVYGGPDIVTDGLVLHLDAANDKSYPGSGTTWSDLSGNGNNGTLVNGVAYGSSNYGVMSFDGSNDYVGLGNSIGNGFSQISVNCWVKPTTFPNTTYIFEHLLTACDNSSSGLQSVFSLSIAHHNNPTYLPVSFKGNSICFGIRTSNQSYRYRPIGIPDSSYSTYTPGMAIAVNPPEYAINTWMNLCGVFNGSTTYIYINGTLKATSNSQPDGVNRSLSGVLNTSSIPRKIGMNSGSSSRFTGEIQKVSIHNIAFTSEEILQNFEATKGRYGL